MADALIAQNCTKRERAAILLAQDELTDDAIAAQVGVNRKTIHNWKQIPEFAAQVEDAKAKIIAEALKLPIAKMHERVKGLNDLNDTYWQIKAQRGSAYTQMLEDSPENAALREFGYTVPEWATSGMMLAQPKIAANGKTVVEWAFDKALDSAIKETYREAAAELGQREETVNLNHSGINRQYVIVTGDDD